MANGRSLLHTVLHDVKGRTPENNAYSYNPDKNGWKLRGNSLNGLWQQIT